MLLLLCLSLPSLSGCWRPAACRPSSDWKAKLAAAAAEAASAFQEVPFGQSDSEDAPPVGRYSRIMSQVREAGSG